MSLVQVSCVIFIAGDDDCPKVETEKYVADSMKLKKEGNNLRDTFLNQRSIDGKYNLHTPDFH